MAFIPGAGARLMINTTFFSFSLADVNTDPDVQRTTSSEGITNVLGPGIGFHSAIKACRQFTATITEVTFDPVLNLFTPPFNIAEGAVVVFQLWPNGIGDVSYFVPMFLIAGLNHRIDIATLQPVTIRGQSIGQYSLPSH